MGRVLWNMGFRRRLFSLCRYGLIFPKKTRQKTFVKHAVFMDDSDEESSVGESLQREALKKQAMKQTKLEIQRALAEDSTVYEYDAIYDDIQQKKAESQASVLAGKGEKKPKYIQNILKAAELRKKEQEKRAEKKIQKEREMEGHAFDDKEAFVTSAYKKKLQERAEEEEREKREAEIEACLDVTKQRDLSGFYRHLLNQAVGEEAMPACSLREARLKEEEPGEEPSESRPTGENAHERATPGVPGKGADNPDADSDLGVDSSDDEDTSRGHTDGSAEDKKGTKQGHSDSSGDFLSKSGRSRRDLKSSVEEKKHHSKTPPSHPERQEGGRKGKTGQPKEKDSERKDRDRGKGERLRSAEDRPRRQQEREDRQRRKDRKERDEYDRELKREREREHQYSQWEEQVKERHTSHSDPSKEGERAKGGREGREEEGQRERENGGPRPLAKDDPPGQKTGLGKGEGNPPGSEEQPELKRTASEEGAEQIQAPLEKPTKFAKRSNQETVLSARDRYLARQMARIGTKSYIEKEED
ncbi:hypothetical protein JRQ81_008434 [Phrynocephalus forsythii]|uniref:Nuclear speckle splicing regulatory protein 1 n=1 Tax=Phrynocephalus forsythii TaxID=171643 RepID=A0A9Q0XCB1_9SAUR|nr:hypothetical protein JRQ81_008434 [Phrynocephalus forsythii]